MMSYGVNQVCSVKDEVETAPSTVLKTEQSTAEEVNGLDGKLAHSESNFIALPFVKLEEQDEDELISGEASLYTNAIKVENGLIKQEEELNDSGNNLSCNEAQDLRNQKVQSANTCHVCKKVFTLKGNLKKHLRIHTGERPFLCNMCSKSFFQKQALTEHMRIHSGDKPFSCNICNMSFTQKVNLMKHMCIHSEVRPYLCNECNRSFIQKCSLKKHIMARHSGKHPFSCDVCKKYR